MIRAIHLQCGDPGREIGRLESDDARRGFVGPYLGTGRRTLVASCTAGSEETSVRGTVVVVFVLGAAPVLAQSSRATVNQLSAAERAAGWRVLFDGTTLAGWRGLGYDSIPTVHWNVVDGAIHKVASGNVPKMPDGQPANGGDLMTVDTFRDFELAFEWKVMPGTNSGVKYNVSEEYSLSHASNHAALGLEYQVLDDSLNDDNKLATHRAGALYDLLAPSDTKRLMPVGQ
jgi:hypothetical protein